MEPATTRKEARRVPDPPLSITRWLIIGSQHTNVRHVALCPLANGDEAVQIDALKEAGSEKYRELFEHVAYHLAL